MLQGRKQISNIVVEADSVLAMLKANKPKKTSLGNLKENNNPVLKTGRFGPYIRLTLGNDEVVYVNVSKGLQDTLADAGSKEITLQQVLLGHPVMKVEVFENEKDEQGQTKYYPGTNRPIRKKDAQGKFIRAKAQDGSPISNYIITRPNTSEGDMELDLAALDAKKVGA